MIKPVILTLDDDLNVLQSIQQDLRSQFGAEYKIVRSDNGKAALEMLVEFQRRGNPVALFLVDQRMPGMTGVEFLEQAKEIYPDAKRILLTAYADTDAAIQAINSVQVDYYLLKPWDPPEEKLYPPITDLLEDWKSTNVDTGGIRLVGYQWSPKSHQIKDFLARNNIPYQWLNLELNPKAKQLLEAAELDDPVLPCVFFADGSVLQNPENLEIAERSGLQTIAENPYYDLIVVGAGPAGLAAAVYGASEGLKTLVVEKEAPGGQAGMSSRIENYLGFPGGLSGAELSRRAVSQAKRFGVEILTPQEVVSFRSDGPSKILTLGNGEELNCRALIISTGVSYRKVEAQGVEDLTGAGIYYGAAMSEGESVKNGNVYIVGGANSAGQAAMYFSRFAKNVFLMIRGDSLEKSMSSYLIDQISQSENINVLKKTEVKEAIGTNRLESLIISREGNQERVKAKALFIFIGAKPHTDWLEGRLVRDDKGFIMTGQELISAGIPFERKERQPFMLESCMAGVFVAGDVRHGSVKRVASAVGEGSMAVMYVHRYLAEV